MPVTGVLAPKDISSIYNLLFEKVDWRHVTEVSDVALFI